VDWLYLRMHMNLHFSGRDCREGHQRWIARKANNDGGSAISLGGSTCFRNTPSCCAEWWRDCREGLLAMGFFVNKESFYHHWSILYIN
jgi:hypothetical protein